jgi:hypothetical protein
MRMPLHGFKRHGRTQEQKDECTVRMDDLERDYWMGADVGQLGGYGFHGAIFGFDGSSKHDQGVVNSYMK